MPGCPHSVLGWSALCVSVAFASLSGCREPPAPSKAATEIVRPAEILVIASTDVDSSLRFPGRVRAVQRADLAFNVAGRLVEFPVKEGAQLEAGALIARLDPAAYRSRLAAAQAEFDKARTDYERVRTIWEKSQAVPRAEVDQKRAALEVSRSSLAAARKDVEDTRLIAPFAGLVARRFVENFQNVQAKEPIVSLQDVSQLEIVIHVPERIVRGEPKRAAAFAEFEGLPGRRFPITLKSFATEADAQTQTYEVILGLARPEGVTVLPGMSVTVYPDAQATGTEPSAVRIPLKAVAADSDGAPYVWVVDAQTSRVAKRGIAVGAVHQGDITVLSGLAAGERIVTAGVQHLREGMPVRPLQP